MSLYIDHAISNTPRLEKLKVTRIRVVHEAQASIASIQETHLALEPQTTSDKGFASRSWHPNVGHLEFGHKRPDTSIKLVWMLKRPRSNEMAAVDPASGY